jgi:hypothetical protein
MKFSVRGDRKRIIEVCEEINKVKEQGKGEALENMGKFSKTKKWAGFVTKMGGKELDFGSIYDSIAVSYWPEGDSVVVNMPVYIPKGVRLLLKGKIMKEFRDIFSSHCGDVEVEFISWGDEDLKKVK